MTPVAALLWGVIVLGWRWRRPVTGLAAGVILCFMPDLARAWGNECSLLIGLFVMGWLSFRRGLFWFLRRTVFDTPVGALVIIGGLLMIRLPRFLPLIMWCVVHVGAYYLLGVPGHYYWYFYPLWLGIAVAMGEAIAVLGEALPEARGRDAKANWAPLAVTLGLTL